MIPLEDALKTHFASCNGNAALATGSVKKRIEVFKLYYIYLIGNTKYEYLRLYSKAAFPLQDAKCVLSASSSGITRDSRKKERNIYIYADPERCAARDRRRYRYFFIFFVNHERFH